MKKKLLSLTMLLVLFLVGCKVNTNNPKAEPDATYSSFAYSFTDEDYKYLNECVDEVKSLVEKGENAERLIELYDWMNKEQSDLAHYRSIENINYYMTGNKAYSDKQEFYHNTLLDLYKAQLEIFEPVSQNNLRDEFFKGWTEQQIQDEIDFAKTEIKALPLYKKRQELQNKAVAINDKEEMKPILLDVIKTNNELAELWGYDNYLKYAFDNTYYRGYDISEAPTLLNNIKEYVLPCLNDITEKYLDYYGRSTNQDIKEIQKFDDESFKNYHNLVNGYTKSLGGDINQTYNDLLNSKYLFVATEKTAIQSAWTDYMYNYNTPIMYTGNGYYQCVNTFIHEFGHYLSMKAVNSSGGDYDTAETQSQSNEALFQVYLRNNYKNISENGLKTLNYYWLSDKMETVANCALVYACEEALYQEENLTIDKIDNICKGALKKYFNLGNDDGRLVYSILCAASSPAYYISYSTSAISSISMYKQALDNYEQATKTYLDLIKVGDKYAYPEKIIELNITNALDSEEVRKLFVASNF